MMTDESLLSGLDSNKVFDALIEGNPFAWLFFSVMMIILFLVAWIKFESSMRSFFLFMGSLFHYKSRRELELEQNAFNLTANKFFDKISLLLSKAELISLSKDVGRNLFYHFMLKTALTMIYSDFREIFNMMDNKKMSKNVFCSYDKLYSPRINRLKTDYEEMIKKRLKEEGWEEDKVLYAIKIFNQWFSDHLTLLSELISSSKEPTEIVMAWWIFFYEVYMTLERFGLMLNGRITGQYFEKVRIGKPS